jgi:hypothetical protein
MAGTKRSWLVTGYDSTETIYEQRFPLSAFSEKQMICFLQRLVSKHLTYDEIASLSRKRKSKESLGEYEPNIEGTIDHYTVSVGSNPYFIAMAKEID